MYLKASMLLTCGDNLCILCKVFFFTLLRNGGALLAKNLNISILLDFYGDMLTDKQRDVVELYYNEDLSLAEIAEHSGITRQGVRDSIKRAESQLFEYETKLKLAARFSDMQESFEEIIRNSQRIMDINDHFVRNSEISSCAKKIIELADTVSNG